MKSVIILLSLLIWSVSPAAVSFAGDIEQTLSRDLTECGRSVKQIIAKGETPSSSDLQRLGTCAETLHADRLLLAERHSAIAQRVTGRGGERHQSAAAPLLTQLDELLSRLDAVTGSGGTAGLPQLLEAIDRLIAKRARPLLGTLPYKHTGYARVNRDRLLAEAIPALSRAAGRNSVEAFGREDAFNFDMQNRFKINGQWPNVRLDGKYFENWLHSDIREVAYPYVNGLFLKLVELGGRP